MSYYAPMTNELNQLSHIEAAYLCAGLEAPKRANAVLDLLGEQPTMTETAAVLAREAVDGVPDPQAWLDGAMVRIRDAQALDALRIEVNMAIPVATSLAIPALVDDAAQALAPAVDKAAKALAKAAKALPTKGDPFDLSTIVANHTSREAETAQAALVELSAYAGAHLSVMGGDKIAREVAPLLPIITVPVCVVEQRPRTLSGFATPANRDDLDGTLAVRSLESTARNHGADRALLDVARGRWPGITIALASYDELAQRVEQVTRAATVESVAAVV
ncbi:hypothetical protein [Ornithinimicrobium cryptoxanthini]|uniref:hypothetical protein n=1 Tax=Ornithinimicrobium cryptoxanthini TaxID=2934161 RepID=UPI0021185DD7|nr:hypothetical protein [Ornithinimicrobium cryptoxanthini]